MGAFIWESAGPSMLRRGGCPAEISRVAGFPLVISDQIIQLGSRLHAVDHGTLGALGARRVASTSFAAFMAARSAESGKITAV